MARNEEADLDGKTNVISPQIGLRRPVSQFSARRVLSPQLIHAIYDRLLFLLEDRQLVHVASGEIVPVFHEKSRDELNRAGWSDLDIAREEARRIDCLSGHPNWGIEQSVPVALYYSLTTWDDETRCRRFEDEDDEDLLFENRIVAVPHFLLNALVVESLLRMFGRAELLACPGFVERDGLLLLDLDAYLAGRGFLVPVVRGGLIAAIRVFRHPKDARPFLLRSRS